MKQRHRISESQEKRHQKNHEKTQGKTQGSLPEIQRPESYWIASNEKTNYAPLQENRTFDVVVVGGGIAGLTAAYLLKKAGARVAVLEQHQIANGESGHTTAHLTEIVDTRYQVIQSHFGRTGASLVVQSSRRSIDFIESQANLMREKWDIDCHFHRIPGYLYTEDPEQVRALKKELRAMKAAGIKAQWNSSIPLPFKTSGGIEIPHQARFHPHLYLRGLAQEIHGNGSMIFENSKAVKIKEGVACTTSTVSGHSLTSMNLVVTTNFPVSNRFSLQTKVAPYRTYAMAVRLSTDLPPDGLYWDTADPYHYSRIDEDLWIVGGEDHKTGQKEDTDESYAALESYIRSRYPVESVSHRWSGQILESVDGLPYIGRNAFSKNIFVATGFAGNGMTFGTISGMLISDLVQSKKNPWADLYQATRIKPLAAAQDFVKENLDYPICLIKDRLAASDVSSLSEISLGDGKRMRIEGETYAVYRDQTGEFHAVHAVCPHMGCLVHFNYAEKSWDCPCHGSRFNTDGAVLNGPSTTPLEKATLHEIGLETHPGKQPDTLKIKEPRPKKIA